MKPVLYIDILFLVNWMMDTVVLILTGRFLKRRIRLWAVSLAAALGALWVCLCAAFSLSGWWIHGTGLTAVAAVMVQTAYPSRTLREGLRACGCLYLAAVLTGGVIHVICDNTAFGRFWRLWMSGSEAEAVSVWLLAAAMAASFAAIQCGIRYCEASKNRQLIQDVTLYDQGKTLTVAALWDSGNQLYDPFTGKAVHIVELEACEELLGKARCTWVRRLAAGRMHGESRAESEAAAAAGEILPEPALPEDVPVRLIPCHSLGNAHGLLPVVTMTALETAAGERMEHPLIGLCLTSLSTDHSYRMLLHSQTDKKRRNL